MTCPFDNIFGGDIEESTPRSPLTMLCHGQLVNHALLKPLQQLIHWCVWGKISDVVDNGCVHGNSFIVRYLQVQQGFLMLHGLSSSIY